MQFFSRIFLKLLSAIPRIKKKLKCFCLNFFHPCVTKIKEIFIFLIFNSVYLLFVSFFWNISELIALRKWNSNLLKLLRYLKPFRKYNEKRFSFLTVRHCSARFFLGEKRLFRPNTDLKWVVYVDYKLILFFATGS